MKCHDIVVCDAYDACMDEYLDDEGVQFLLMHINVDPDLYSVSVARKIRREWALLRECIEAPLWAIEPHFQDTKWERFVAPLGFTFSHVIDWHDGLRRMFVSLPKKFTNGRLQQDHHTEPDSD